MMRSRGSVIALSALIALVAAACGGDSGTPDYSDQIGIVPPNIKYDEPDPYQPGKARLSVEAFYEGGRSETIYINGFQTHYFVFGGPELGRDTYTESASGDRVEGKFSDELKLVGTPFWGGGIVWDKPVDLSKWKMLFVNFKSSDSSFSRFALTLLSGDGATPNSVTLNPTDYGYTNDGEWHFLQIPLSDAIALGFDPRKTRSPFIIGASGGTSGHTLLVDNLYLTQF